MRFFALIATLALAACGGGGGQGSDTPPIGGGADTEAPTVPTGLEVVADSNSSVALAWRRSSDDTGVFGYRVYRGDVLVDTAFGTSASDGNLVTGVSYCYRVSAFDEAGNESERSTPVCATPDNVWTKRTPGADMVVTGFAFDGQRYVAIGDRFDQNRVLVSEDGVRWTGIVVSPVDLIDIVWTGSLFVAISDRGIFYSSENGEDWRSRGRIAEDLSALAWSGSTVVAVGEFGVIWTTTDGIEWTQRNNPVAELLHDVVWANGRFVAVGSNGTVVTSPDGVTWTEQANAVQRPFFAVAANGSTFVAVSGNAAYTSSDAAVWAPTVIPGVSLRDVVWADFLGLFVGLDRNGAIVTSPDGINWTERVDTDDLGSMNALYAANGLLLAGGANGEITTSTNAVTWTTRHSSFRIERLRYQLGTLYAVGGPSTLATSTDGVQWSYFRTGHDGDFFQDIADSGSRIVAAAQTFYTSTPSLAETPWPVHDFFGATSASNAIIWDGSRFVAVGSGGIVRSSTDGISYTAATDTTTGTSSPLTGIVYDGSQYVVVGFSGTLLTTPDLQVWTDRSGVTTSALRDLAWSGSRFVAVGDAGTIVYSDDGIVWNAADSGTTSLLFGVTWAGDEFVAVGASSTVLRSADAVTWQPYSDSIPIGTFKGVAYSGSQLVIAGDDGLIATLEK